MIVFTASGVLIVTILVLTALYGIFYAIANSEEFLGLIAFIVTLSILFTTFVISPQAYGYQKIDTVSVNEVR